MQIAFGGSAGSDADRLIREAHRQSITIGLGIADNRANAHFMTGTDDTDGDFAAISNKYFFEHEFNALSCRRRRQVFDR